MRLEVYRASQQLRDSEINYEKVKGHEIEVTLAYGKL